MPPEKVKTPLPFFAIVSPASFTSDGENGMSPNDPEVYAFEIRQLWAPKEAGAPGPFVTISWSINGLMGMSGGFWPPQPFWLSIEPVTYAGRSKLMLALSALISVGSTNTASTAPIKVERFMNPSFADDSSAQWPEIPNGHT